jgi:hypothetical protein
MRPYALALAALLLAVPANAHTGLAVPLPPGSPPPPLHEHPVPGGPRVAGTGMVLATPGRPVLFCPPRPVNVWSPSPAPPPCADGIPAEGADTGRLAHRGTQEGAVWGDAWLTGVLNGGTLYVTGQGPPRDDTSDPFAGLRAVPCPEPPGGWPRGEPSLAAADRYAATHRGEVVDVRYALPPGGAHVLVVTLRHPALAEAALRPAYGTRLCLVRSRYTVAQVARTRAAISRFMSEHRGVSGGAGFTASPDGQPWITFDVDVLTPEVRSLVAAQPRGLVRLTVWLAEVSPSGAAP